MNQKAVLAILVSLPLLPRVASSTFSCTTVPFQPQLAERGQSCCCYSLASPLPGLGGVGSGADLRLVQTEEGQEAAPIPGEEHFPH